MIARAQVTTQAKKPVAPQVARIPQPPVVTQMHEAEPAGMAGHFGGAARLGHSLREISVASAETTTILPQEVPEEEEPGLQREPDTVQRKNLPEEGEEELQTKPDSLRVGPEGGPVPPDIEAAIGRAKAGGQSLDGDLQVQMGETLGHDFSTVRVHTDAEADALNQELSAKAFTTGRDIFFRQGVYEPASSSGRELLAHELTHVVQQSSGRISGGKGGCGMTVYPVGGAFENEADTIGNTALSSILPSGALQRRVAVTSDNKDDDADYVTLNSIAFGNTIAGGRIENFKDANFSDLKQGEKIAMVGHGMQGQSGNYTGDQIAYTLTEDRDRKMGDGQHDITFTSCYAGARTKEESYDSVVDIVKAKIKAMWPGTSPTIKGATGPSVKTIQAGENDEAWGVVKDTGIAKKVQIALNGRYRVEIGKKPEQPFPPRLTLQEKAGAVQAHRRAYFMDFVHLINGEWSAVDLRTQRAVEAALSKDELDKVKQGKIGAGLREA